MNFVVVVGQVLDCFPAINRHIRNEVGRFYGLFYFQKVFPQQPRQSRKRANARRDRIVLVCLALSVLNEVVVFEVVNDGLHGSVAKTQSTCPIVVLTVKRGIHRNE